MNANLVSSDFQWWSDSRYFCYTNRIGHLSLSTQAGIWLKTPRNCPDVKSSWKWHLQGGGCWHQNEAWQGLKENKHLKRKGGAVQQQSWLCCKEEGLRIQGFLLEHRCFRVHFGSTSVYLLKSNPSLFCLNVQLQIFHPSSNEFRRSILFLERRTSSAAFSLSS